MGNGWAAGRVIGGCAGTTRGGTGESGGGRVTDGCPDAVGSSTGSGLVDNVDGPTGFELLLQAAKSTDNASARVIPHIDRWNGLSHVAEI
jgi:hypothetical protein